MKSIMFAAVMLIASTSYGDSAARFGSGNSRSYSAGNYSSNYSSRNYYPVRSYSNIWGGTDYRSGSSSVRSVPSIHGGYNYYSYPASQNYYRQYDR